MRSQIICFLELVRRELYLFFREFKGRMIDMVINMVTWVVVFGYFMSDLGLQSSYGALVLVGVIASFGLFETVFRATALSEDVFDKQVSNFLVLPMPSSWFFIAISVAWAISSGILSISLLPIGKVILWNKFDLSKFSAFKFCTIFVIGNLFYGFFALWLSSLVVNLRNSSWLWNRVISPLYMFCGFFYSWQNAYDIAPWVGYLHLLNPMIYILEGTKAAVFGQEEYLPFWICAFATLVFTLFFYVHSIRKLKKRADFV